MWFHKLSSDNPGIPVRTEREKFVTYPHCIFITSSDEIKLWEQFATAEAKGM